MAYTDEVLRSFYTKKASGKTGIPSPADYYKGQLFAEAGNMQNKRRNELDRANLSTAQQAVEAQRAFNNQSLADAELNRQAQEKAQQMQTLTSLGSTAATAYGLSDSTLIGDTLKTGVQAVAPSVAEYLGLKTAAQKVAAAVPKVVTPMQTAVQAVVPAAEVASQGISAANAASTAAGASPTYLGAASQGLSSTAPAYTYSGPGVGEGLRITTDAANTAGTEIATQGLSGVGANTAAQGATGSAIGDTLGVTTGEVIGAAGKTAANVIGNAGLYYALGKAAQYGGEKMHENNQSYPLAQFGHNIQDATTLPGYTESGLNEGYKTVDRDGRTFGTYDTDARGTTANIIEGVLPVESGSLGRALRKSIDAAGRLNTGDMMDAAGQVMSPFTSVVEKAFGYQPGESPVINTLANPISEIYSSARERGIWDTLNRPVSGDNDGAKIANAVLNPGAQLINDVQDNNWGSVAASVFTGGLSNIFCFAFDTQMQMQDGSEQVVQDIDVLDEMLEGGCVTAVGKALSDNIYSYKGILVEGHHAVFNDGEWKRVYDCPEAKFHGSGIVYPIVNENHIIIVDGIVFADMVETPLGWDVSENERIEWLNSQTKRNELLKERYDNSSVSETEALRNDVQVVE